MTGNFKVNEYCVYKTHGIAKIANIKDISFGNFSSKCLVLYFEKDKLNLTVPYKFKENGDLRKPISLEEMDEVFEVLRNGVRKIKGMWSRRVKEYEEKINSGNLFLTAEVLRDLTRDVEECDRSYSERIIYENALYRLSSEFAIVKKISQEQAKKIILEIAKEKIKFIELEEKDEKIS